ncbi:ATP-binding protein [Thermodesulfatator indicus]
MKKKLPVGIQSFENIRTENYYYVDKTRFVKKLVDEGKYYFLSRPRRFGKSLFLDTLRQAFLAKKELFEGLYLENNWDWSVKYPVVYISFGSGVIREKEIFQKKINYILDDHAQFYDVCLTKNIIPDKANELFQKLADKCGQKVVVLIDEYDKPILDNIENKDVAIEIREELKNFYSVLKDADPYLKFVFITGVTKFSKVSLFSGLNNLKDITLHSGYATICGYTQSEFETVFADRLEGVDLDEVRRWYNGYSWIGDPVYNPFDILLFLDLKEFRPYWFETGTPSFLIKLLYEKRFFLPEMENLEAGESLVSSFDVDYIEPEPVLFQTGYLTIRERKQRGPRIIYRLSYPNLEVKMSFNDHLLNWYTRVPGEKERNLDRVYEAFERNDIEGLKEAFRSFFVSIPHDWYRKTELHRYEGFYASVFYAYFAALGLDVRVEDSTSKGRLDMAVRFEDRCYLFEFKVVEIEPEGRALEQLKAKKYHEKYLTGCGKIYLIGVEFSQKERNIVGFEWEEVL